MLLAPDWIAAEVANALWKKVRRNELTSDEAATILQEFDFSPVEVFPLKFLLLNAFELAVTLDRTVYDSLYLALAVDQKCKFVTADKRFHSVVAQSEFSDHVAWIEDEL